MYSHILGLGCGHPWAEHYSVHHSLSSGPQRFIFVTQAKYIHPSQGPPKSRLITASTQAQVSPAQKRCISSSRSSQLGMEEAPAKQQDGQEENSLGHWLSPREGSKSLPVPRREPPPGRGSCRGHKAQSASRPAAPRTPRAPTPSQGSTHRKTRDSHPADDHVEAQTAPRPRPSPRGSPAPGPALPVAPPRSESSGRLERPGSGWGRRRGADRRRAERARFRRRWRLAGEWSPSAGRSLLPAAAGGLPGPHPARPARAPRGRASSRAASPQGPLGSADSRTRPPGSRSEPRRSFPSALAPAPRRAPPLRQTRPGGRAFRTGLSRGGIPSARRGPRGGRVCAGPPTRERPRGLSPQRHAPACRPYSRTPVLLLSRLNPSAPRSPKDLFLGLSP